MLYVERSPVRTHFSESSVCVNRKMPVDFQSYLFSTSPPGFDLHYNIRSVRETFGFGSESSPRRVTSCKDPSKSLLATSEESEAACEVLGQNSNFNNNLCQTSERLKQLNSEYFTRTPSPEACDLSDSLCELSLKQKSKTRCKKKVSFADETGKAIAAIRVFTESPDSPPQIRREMLSSLTMGASAGVTETPPLVLNFSQPASDYIAFRQRIERDFLSLENVILKDYNLIGTVKVKNIAFEKKVTLRFTCDSWETHTDISANYAPSSQNGNSVYDTFSFEISVPPNFSIHKKIQFAVCFEANNRQYWDNNNGKNYEVVSADWKEESESKPARSTKTIHEESPVFDFSFDEPWTQFSSWSYADNDSPYY